MMAVKKSVWIRLSVILLSILVSAGQVVMADVNVPDVGTPR